MATSGHVRLLSIDGGGVRGLTSIIILKRIMARINKGRADKLQPYEVFDLIAGTGVGGLIALMLGRLHMSLDDVEREYKEFLRRLLQSSEVVHRLSDHLAQGVDTAYEVAQEVQALSQNEAEFPTEPVRLWLRALLMRKGRDLEELLKDPDLEVPCKAFLTAWHAGDSSPRILRTYRNTEWEQPEFNQMTMYEAACATAAASPGFLPFQDRRDMHLPSHNYTKIHLQWINPVHLVLREAQEVWKGMKFLILSIGTGAAPKGKTDLEQAFHEAEKVADNFSREHRVHDPVTCYRLNVEEGMDRISLAELQEGPEIARAVDDYLSKSTVGPILDGYIEAMMSNRRLKDAIQIHDKNTFAAVCGYCHQGVRFESPHKLCNDCFVLFCDGCAKKHPKDHMVYDVTATRWTDDLNSSRNCKCGKQFLTGLECQTAGCTFWRCDNCIARDQQLQHGESAAHNSYRMIRPTWWRVDDLAAEEDRRHIDRRHNCDCGIRNTENDNPKSKCVVHCQYCFKPIPGKASPEHEPTKYLINFCKICMRENGSSQVLCEDCYIHKAGQHGQEHQYWYKVHINLNAQHEALKCRTCNENVHVEDPLHLIEAIDKHNCSNQDPFSHYELDIPPQREEAWLVIAYQSCAKRADRKHSRRQGQKGLRCFMCNDGLKVEKKHKGVPVHGQPVMEHGFCMDCENVYCNVCRTDDIDKHYKHQPPPDQTKTGSLPSWTRFVNTIRKLFSMDPIQSTVALPPANLQDLTLRNKHSSPLRIKCSAPAHDGEAIPKRQFRGFECRSCVKSLWSSGFYLCDDQGCIDKRTWPPDVEGRSLFAEHLANVPHVSGDWCYVNPEEVD